MSLDQYSKEELQEMALIEVAYELLKEKKQPLSFSELIEELKAVLDLHDEDTTERMVQFYTDLNIDGRFLNLGENRWGLRVWYPVDQAEEEIITPVKPRKKKAKKKVVDDDGFDEIEDEDFDVFDEDEEDLLDDEDDEDLDDFDEDEEEFDDDDLIEDEDDLELDEDEEEFDDDLEEEEDI